MARTRRVRLRTLVVVAIVLLLLAGLGAGFEWIYDRGLKREGLFERAHRAFAEGRNDDAIALAREALASEPNRDAAREVILEALCAAGREDEAKEEARRFLDENPERSFAAIRLCELHLGDGNIDEAERLAPTFADREPVHASNIVAIVRDYRGLLLNDWKQRLEAAALMRGIASLTENEGVKAESILNAAEVSRELLPALPQADLLDQRTQADLKEAAKYANAAVQSNKGYPYDLVMGRIRALSSDAEEAALGARMLRPFSTGALKRDVAVAALTRYHVARGEWKEAADLAHRIEESYLWHRLCWSVRRSADPDQAITLLEGGPFAASAEAVLLRAELMVRSSDAARKEQGIKALGAIVEDPSSAAVLVVRALHGLAAGAGVDVALACAERARLEERSGDARLTAAVAALLSARGSERGLELAARLATETDEMAQSQDLMRLLGGSQAFDRYVDAQVGKGGDAELRYRLYRAHSLLARARALKDDPAGTEALKQRIRADLDVLRASERATKPELVVGFQLAAMVGEPEIAGAFLARALSLAGEPAMLEMRVLSFARDLKDPATTARLAAGMRGAATELPNRAFLDVFSELVSAGDAVDAKAMVARLEEAAREPGSRGPALELAATMAFGEADMAAAERLARAALEVDPRSAAALEIVGATLLRRGALQEVLAFHGAVPAEQRPEAAWGHMVRANLVSGHKDEALRLARESVRRFPGSAASSLLLAQLYRDLGDVRKALGVLSLAPSHPLIVHLRAELLRQVGDFAMAERFYQLLLSGTRFSDLVAWQGLMDTLGNLGRSSEFAVLAERVLKSGALKSQPRVAAAVHYMRGRCLESDGRIEEALVDYEDAIRLDGKHWGALNNAAWHIARGAQARIAEARAYVDRAMNINPEEPSVLDTAAEVYSVQLDADGALKHMDRAIALAPEARQAGYLVHKGEILMRGGRDEEAKALLEAVRRDHRDDAAGQKARSLLWEIEHKNLPEEPPEQLPAVPEEEEKRPGTGGGE